MSDAAELYETDFFGWTEVQVARLRQAQSDRPNAVPDLDWAHLAEQIEELGKSLGNELFSRYMVLLAHLLKWQVQPGRRSSSWRGSIDEQRYRIARLLRRNPSLRRLRQEEFADAYPSAVREAVTDTGFDESLFPSACPFSLDQVEDTQFWPEKGR